GGVTTLADLLRMISDINGIERIRFITSHPADLDDNLIDAIAKLPKVCEHLHLPIQSGSDNVLDMMKRNYTYNCYTEKIRRVRDAIPDISITTDIITGFPGETDDDFNRTMDALMEIQYDNAFAFKYSRRPYSPARLYENQIPSVVGRERLNKVIELQNSITLSKNQECIGMEYDVLIEGESKKDKGKLTGRTRTNRLVHVPKKTGIHAGDILRVKISSATLSALTGEAV
ncbi:MAG: radical SAM protein, partial [Nitrospirota bacterium]